MLSNTAVPKYYGEFRNDVLAGRIQISREIAMEMKRIDELIKNPLIYYDPAVVEGFIAFCESELTLTDGEPLTLVPSFKLWGEQLFGWYYFEEQSVWIPNPNGRGGHYKKFFIKRRLINKQIIITGRGAAKSIYCSCIQSYIHTTDPTTTNQITTSPTMKQSEEIISTIVTAITKARGPLFKVLTNGNAKNTRGPMSDRKKLVPVKDGILNRITNSLIQIRPMSIKKLQGLRCKVATIDEWLSGDIREDVIGAIEQGASKVDDYIIVAVSSEGTVRNGPGDDVKMEMMNVLKGDYYNPHMSIFWYKLDDVKEVSNPEMWIKANPNIGKTVSYRVYQAEVERAEKVPSATNDILAKRFGIPTEGYTYFFRYEETLPFIKQCFWQMTCAMGADLSQGNDFCAFTFLFPLSNGSFGVKTRCYITELTLSKLKPALRMKYQAFIEEGSLIVMNGIILNMMDVYDDLDEHIVRLGYDVQAFGYDPYNAKEFVERWISENSDNGVEKVIQGAKTESVPLGELKNLAEQRMLLFDEALMSFTMGNAIVIKDNNGNMKLQKKYYEAKIDSVAALMDAWVAYKRNVDNF